MKKTCTALAVAMGLMGLTMANSAFARVDIKGEVGTTGIGFHASIPLKPDLNLRLGMGYLGYGYSGKTDSMKYDLSLKARTYDALLDWYPQEKSSFRVTAGLAYNGSKIDVGARPDAAGQYTLQGNTYDAASVGRLSGQADFGKVAPYLGIGWGRPMDDDKGWSFSTDIGVRIQGSPRTTLDSSGCTATAAVCNRFAADVARENAALRDEMGKFRLYPVLRIGVNYRF